MFYDLINLIIITITTFNKWLKKSKNFYTSLRSIGIYLPESVDSEIRTLAELDSLSTSQNVGSTNNKIMLLHNNSSIDFEHMIGKRVK